MRKIPVSRPLLIVLDILAPTAVAGLVPLTGQARKGSTLEGQRGESGARTGVLVSDGTRKDLAMVSPVGLGILLAVSLPRALAPAAVYAEGQGCLTISPASGLVGSKFHV